VSVAVITATSGRPELLRCVGSVRSQTLPCTHYIITDAGVVSPDEYFFLRNGYPDCSVSYWDGCAGKSNGASLEGRRLYAAASGLIDEDYVLMLNDDDWFEPDHVESLVKIIQGGKDWAFSFRKIYNKEGDFLFEDNCEALGLWPVWNNICEYLIEHSAFCMKRDVFNTFGPVFNYKGFGVDRVFARALKENVPSFGCSHKHSLCYSLGGNPGSVTKDFFIAGNTFMRQKYPDGFPWAPE